MEVSLGQNASDTKKTILRRELTFMLNNCLSKLGFGLKKQTSTAFNIMFRANSVRVIEGSSKLSAEVGKELNLERKPGVIVLHGPRFARLYILIYCF